MPRLTRHSRPSWRVLAVTVAISCLFVPAWAQTQPAAPAAGQLAGGQALAAAGNAVPSGRMTAAEADSDDPIDDRGILEMATAMAGDAWGWVSYSFGSLFSAVTPPTPASMVRDLQDDNQMSTFFQSIGDAGYKIKEIENGVGLPPAVTIKFGRIRNLSDADIDYMERGLLRWAKKETGLVAEAQRAVIWSLVAINQSDTFVVDTVAMRVLPLPQFKFTLAPTIGGLGWESSQLMRAIQRLDRRVAEVQRKG